jgi:hypothetical protein
MTTNRLAGNDQRAREVVKHLTATFEHLGRLLHALNKDNWDSTRDHLSLVGERAAITNSYLNGGSPNADQTLTAVRAQLDPMWADAIAAFLAGGTGPAATAQEESGTSRNDPEQSRTVPYVSGQHRTPAVPTREEETRGD